MSKLELAQIQLLRGLLYSHQLEINSEDVFASEEDKELAERTMKALNVLEDELFA